MRVARAPLRITLGGGGSDLSPGGLCITAAISLTAYVAYNTNDSNRYILKYHDQVEHVRDISEIQHPTIRRCLQIARPAPGIELASFCDVAGGTGLGASGAFSVATFAALNYPNPIDHAIQADIGWQDQRATRGGVRILAEDDETLLNVDLSDLRLYDTGIRHDAQQTLTATRRPDQTVLRDQVTQAVKGLDTGDFSFLADQWVTKLAAAPTHQHYKIDGMIRQLGVPAKLVGAGNGGMILAWAPDPLDTPLREIPFTIDHKGVQCRDL